jgi:Uncharacterized conserved protein (DUF2278)
LEAVARQSQERIRQAQKCGGGMKEPLPMLPQQHPDSVVRSAALTIPELEHSKTAVLNTLASVHSRRSYAHAIDQFIAWYCSEPRLTFNRIVVVSTAHSTNVTGNEAGEALVAMATGAKKVYAFGEPYTSGLGVHNVHCNQGDPSGEHQPDDGIWQDGCVFALRPTGPFRLTSVSSPPRR